MVVDRESHEGSAGQGEDTEPITFAMDDVDNGEWNLWATVEATDTVDEAGVGDPEVDSVRSGMYRETRNAYGTVPVSKNCFCAWGARSWYLVTWSVAYPPWGIGPQTSQPE